MDNLFKTTCQKGVLFLQGALHLCFNKLINRCVRVYCLDYTNMIKSYIEQTRPTKGTMATRDEGKF